MLRTIVRMVSRKGTQPHPIARGNRSSSLPVPPEARLLQPPPDKDASMLGIGIAGVLYTASVALTGYSLGSASTPTPRVKRCAFDAPDATTHTLRVRECLADCVHCAQRRG